MGMIDRAFGLLFGGGNMIAQTAEVFRENAEGAAQRQATQRAAVLAQFAGEFAHPPHGAFDRVIDGLNRLPRPAMAFGTLGLFVAAMVDPVWFSSRMVGLTLIPEPLWWLLGAIVSFYFGARYQVKGQEFQRSVAAAVARAPGIVPRPANSATPRQEPSDEPAQDAAPPLGHAAAGASVVTAFGSSGNAALDDWRAGHG